MKNNILIGIDGNEANISDRVGVNKYAFEILWGVYKLLKTGKYPIKIVVYLKNDPLSDMPAETESFKYKVLKGSKVWILTRLMPYLFVTPGKPDVLFSPSHYTVPLAPMPRVCSIMDLGYLEFSAQFRKFDYWQLKWWSAISIKVSKCIMAISNATASDIGRHYPASKGKVVVTHLGFDEALIGRGIAEDDIERVKSKYSIVHDYVLYLGTLKPSKNVEGLVRAWGKIVNKFPQMQLVIGGKKGWLYDAIFAEVKALGLEDKIIFTDYVAEEDKFILISQAKAFVVPSFWEGFGIDILSAFALHVPVVASNVGSLPEVVGDAGILVDPKNINAIAEAIEKTLNMKKIDYDKMVQMQREQLKKFSWEKAAKITLENLIQVANK